MESEYKIYHGYLLNGELYFGNEVPVKGISFKLLDTEFMKSLNENGPLDFIHFRGIPILILSFTRIR